MSRGLIWASAWRMRAAGERWYSSAWHGLHICALPRVVLQWQCGVGVLTCRALDGIVLVCSRYLVIGSFEHRLRVPCCWVYA